MTCPHLKKRDDQLAKAKEIITELITCIREISKPNVELTNVDFFLKQAEDFIKE